MLKIINDFMDVDNLKEFDIIVPSNKLLYYKQKYIKDNYHILTMDNFVLNKYNRNKKLVSKNTNYLMMYKALKEVSSSLNTYRDFITYDFINELICTYNDYYKYELVSNEKINDLDKIFSCYERLLEENNLINERLLFEDVLNNNTFDGNYLIIDLSIPDKNDMRLINKMNTEGNLLLKLDIDNNKYLSRVLNVEEKESNKDREVYFKSLNDVSEEVSFINNDISKRIIDGYSYNDIEIVCNKETYLPYINLLLNHPFSKEQKSGVLVSRFIKIFKEILNGDFSCHQFISLLKLGIFDMDIKMIDKLDNYVYSWDIDSENFYYPFKYNPTGNKNSFSKKDEELLKELNDAKDNVLNPIKYLLENIVGETNKTNLLRIFFTYLKEEKITDKLRMIDSKGYDALVNALEDINEYLDDKTTLVEIINILDKINLSSSKVNNTQNEITISSISDSFLEEKKIVYLLGATQDELPKEFNVSTLINTSDIENNCLIENISNNKDKWYYLFSKLLKIENIVITVPKLGTDLKLKEECSYIKNLNKKIITDDTLFDKSLIINDYALKLSKKEMNVCDIEEFNKINESNLHNLKKNISEENSLKLYSNDLKVSPSSIETYLKCPFYHFCQYGLKLKVKEKYVFDNREVGTFVHYLLQSIIENDLDNITLDNIDEYVKKYSINYLTDNGKIVSNVSNYVIKVLAKSTTKVIRNIVKEREVSSFKPTYFELRVDDESIIKPVEIKLSKGNLKITGIVDRVDTFEDKDNYYYRIIDYKTGEKKLKLDEVLNGLNLQMLLYLLSIKDSCKNLTNKNIVPSAVLYYPALLKEKLSSRGLNDEEKESLVGQRFKMNGIINYDGKVIDALGGESLGDYIDVISRGNISDEKVFGLDDLELLFKNIEDTVRKAGNDILSGKIDVSPLEGESVACAFCKFNSICKYDSKTDKKRRVENLKNSEVFSKLRGDYNAKLD